jgi:short-subunit dehydrogenase
MVKIAVFGSNGDLGKGVIETCRKRGLAVKGFERNPKDNRNNRISEFNPSEEFDCYIFSIGKFDPKPFINMSQLEIREEVESNFILPIELANQILRNQNDNGKRKDLIFIGSTSAYEGFANTSVYCASKFALRGFVESLNKEYKESDIRFYLISMGTMNSRMGEKLALNQDRTTFLNLTEIAEKIVDIAAEQTSIFQPEIIFKRRHVQ